MFNSALWSVHTKNDNNKNNYNYNYISIQTYGQ